jgi:NTP pyrophosphatase (non-canonical NTP hydrolase)
MNDAGYTEFVRALFVNRSKGTQGVMHATMGMAGEAGELLDAIKKNYVYNKALDYTNIIEELGDFEWYAEALRQSLGVTRDFVDIVETSEMLDASAAEFFGAAKKAPLIFYATGLASLAAQGAVSAAWDLALGTITEIEGYLELLKRSDEILLKFYEEIGTSRRAVLHSNVEKLKKRYPAGYTDTAAVARADKQGAVLGGEMSFVAGLERAGYVG